MFKKGQKVNAKVTSIISYGAFCEVVVDDKIVKGLIHISEISDYFVSEIKDFLTVGKEYEVEIIDYIEAKEQLKLSYKRIRPDLLKQNENQLEETGTGFDKLKDSVDKEINN